MVVLIIFFDKVLKQLVFSNQQLAQYDNMTYENYIATPYIGKKSHCSAQQILALISNQLNLKCYQFLKLLK